MRVGSAKVFGDEKQRLGSFNCYIALPACVLPSSEDALGSSSTGMHLLFRFSARCNRSHHAHRLQLAPVTVAAARRSSRAALLCTRTTACIMPRETAAAAGWSPGDAVVFSPASTSSKQASSSNGDDYNARQPLAAVKTSKQAFEKREKPRHHQSTLSPWAKAAWQPGMRVLIATTSSSSRHSTCTDGDEHRSTSRSSKGKQRQVVEDENRIGRYA